MDRRTPDPPGPPIQPSSKSSAAAPKLNSEMELGTFAGQATPPQAAHDDIMQIARVGDVPAMERLFEAGTFDAAHADEEGITPLHVWHLTFCPHLCSPSCFPPAALPHRTTH